MQHVKTVKLGEVCERVSNCDPITDVGDSFFNYIDISSVDKDSKSVIGASKILGVNAPSRARQIIKSDDVLVSTVRPNLNAVAKINGLYHEAVASTGFCVLRPRQRDLSATYLYYWVQSKEFVNEMVKRATGANYPAVSDAIIKNSKIPLPDLDTQDHIAAVLDRADALRQKDRQLLANYEQLPQAVFLELFGNEQILTSQYEATNLCEVADIVSGVTKNTKQTGSHYIDVPYMRVANVQDGRIDLAEVKTISVPPSDLAKYRLLRDDILLTEGGDPDKLGRGAVWHNEIADCIHQNHIFRVRPNQNLINPTYLSFLIGSRYGKRYFLKAAKQTTGIASINMQQLKRFPAVVPSLDTQIQFAHAISEIEQQKKLATAQLAASESLFQSLLHQYFSTS